VTDVAGWNSKVIDEFGANQGCVGPPFEGAPLALVHHRGRKSGQDHVSPTMYLPSDDDHSVIYMFATKSGVPVLALRRD
jgi:hypothetical protein